jgi:hypothetical protein
MIVLYVVGEVAEGRRGLVGASSIFDLGSVVFL